MKATRVLLQLFLAATTAAFAMNASAAMYKWTDKEGNIQYTETPPPEGEATEIAPPPRVTAPAANQQAKGSSDEKGGKGKDEAPLTAEQQEIYKRNCETAKANLETYKIARRIKQADGEVVMMDDEKRQQKMQQAEEQIKTFCK